MFASYAAFNLNQRMDIVFKCEHCNQELSVDESGTGVEIQCPSCGNSITVPHVERALAINPMSTSAGAKEERHF